MPETFAQDAEAAAQEAGADTDGRASSGRGRATRARLLTAAAELIAERGWGEVTTRGIAERAGANQALVHYHFGSVEALLREAAMARLATELEAAMAPLTERRPLEETLRETVASLDRFDLASQPGVLIAEILLRTTRDPILADEMGASLRGFREALQARLEAAAAQGNVRTDVPPDVMAVIVAASLDGLLLQRMVDPQVDPAAVAAGLFRLLTQEE
jgi:AcrR family transcriptional regulator